MLLSQPKNIRHSEILNPQCIQVALWSWVQPMTSTCATWTLALRQISQLVCCQVLRAWIAGTWLELEINAVTSFFFHTFTLIRGKPRPKVDRPSFPKQVDLHRASRLRPTPRKCIHAILQTGCPAKMGVGCKIPITVGFILQQTKVLADRNFETPVLQ